MKETIRKSQKGITLIALIITIIVLIILAAISLMMLSGNDGILARAGNAKITIGQASAEEEVKRAILALQIDGKGNNNGITPAKIAEQVNKDNGRTDVTAEGESFPTNIVYEDGRKVYVKLDLTVGSADDTVEPGVYPINNVAESEVAPPDLFTYEPLTTGANNTKVASSNGLSNLPKKTIKITGIKEQYLNGYTGGNDKGNYGITYKTDTFTLTNMLIIPYQVLYQGEMYTVTEVDLTQKFTLGKFDYGAILPNIGYIIYPNTVTKISFNYDKGETTKNIYKVGEGSDSSINIQKQVILPSSLTEIPESFFKDYYGKSVVIPKSITKLNGGAFAGAKTRICYMGTEEEWNNDVTKENEALFDSDIEYIFNYDINSDGYTTEENEMLKKLNDVFVKQNNYYDKLKSGLYTSKDKELKDLIGYKDFKECYEEEISDILNISVEDFYNQNYNKMFYYSRYLSIIKTIPTDENGKWNRLTELFIKSVNVDYEKLQDVWNAWKEQGKGDYTKYNTLKEYFNGEKENFNYYDETLGYGDFERFVDKCIKDYQKIEFVIEEEKKYAEIKNSIPTDDETKKWDKLTELFIQSEIYKLIQYEKFPAETKANNLAELWKLENDAGWGDFSQYTTLKAFYEGVASEFYDSVEDFIDFGIISPIAEYLVRSELLP